MTTYPTPSHRRTALAPAILAAICLVAGAALIDTEGFTWVLYVVSILALIVSVFAWQAKHWWWLVGLVPIAIVWNPVVPLPVEGDFWRAAQFVAALVFIGAGLLIRVVNPEDRNIRR